MPLHIDCCLCFGRTFAELKAVAEATGAASVDALQAHALFGRRCGLCHPYVRRMLRTGEVVFTEVIRESEDRGTRESEG